ncbi:MAG: LPS assembly lipoprotein LptE [Bdellovibrionales bacterium]
MLRVFILSIIVSSCGYTVGSKGRAVPTGVKRLAVPVFKNSTTEVGYESYFTNAIIEEIIRSNFVKLSPQKNAEAVLEGKILSIRYNSGADLSGASSDDDSSTNLPENAVLTGSYSVVVEVSLRLRRRSDNAILWRSRFSGSRNFQAAKIGLEGFNSANATYDFSARHQTVRDLASQMMTRAYSRMTERF